MSVSRFADRSRDSRHWTVEQCLEAALADFRSGELARLDGGETGEVKQMAIHFYVETSDGTLMPSHYVAGMTHHEYVALLVLSTHKAVEDWRR